MDLRPRRAGVGGLPDAAGVRARVDDVGVERIEDDAADAARRAGRAVRRLGRVAGAHAGGRGAVVDERPRRTAVGRLVQAPLGCARNDRDAAARDGGDTANTARRCRVDRVRVPRDDRDRPDGAGVEDACAERARPRRAAVRRLVDADAGRRVAGGVRLARADPGRVTRRVIRIDGDRAHRLDPEGAGDEVPARLPVQRVLGRPDTAACGSRPQPALAGLAGRGDREDGRPAARDVRVRDVAEGVAELGGGIERLGRADGDPLALLSLAGAELALLRRRCRFRARKCGLRDVGCGIRERGELLLLVRAGAFAGLSAVPRDGPEMLRESCRELRVTRNRFARRRAAEGQPGDRGDRSNERDREGREPVTSSSCHHSPDLGWSPWTCRHRAVRFAFGHDVFGETGLEPVDDLAVEALAGALRRVGEATPQLVGHAQEEAIWLGLPGQGRRL